MKSESLLARARRALPPVLATTALFALALLSPARAAQPAEPGKSEGKAPFSAIHVLGDSLSDTGRTFGVIGVPPFPYYQGRFSNGPVWIEHLAPRLRLPYSPLDNFSWGGANTGRRNVFTGLPGMLDELDELLASARHRLDHKSLYVVFGGSNDFLRILAAGEDPNVVIPQAVNNVITIVRALKAAGADDIVVVDLPNIGLTPRARAGGPAVAAGATYLSTVFNSLLGGALDGLGFPVVRVSAFHLLNDIVAHPGAYGFDDVTTPGILAYPAPADRFLFWDDIHPTAQGHRCISDAVLAALADAGLLKKLTTGRD